MCCPANYFERIFKLIRSIQNSLNRHIKCNAENYGLNTTEFMIMLEIYNNEGISSNDLCKILTLPKSSVSRIVDQLVDKKFVTRIIPEENRRMVRLSISKDFLESKEVINLGNELNCKLLKDLGMEKATRLLSALEEIKSIIEE